VAGAIADFVSQIGEGSYRDIAHLLSPSAGIGALAGRLKVVS